LAERKFFLPDRIGANRSATMTKTLYSVISMVLNKYSSFGVG